MLRRMMLLPAVLVVAACGYRFRQGPSLPEGVSVVHAPVFTNRTGEPALEVAFTEALRRELIRVGGLGGEASPAKMEGEILSVWGQPTVLRSNFRPATYRINASVAVRLLKEGRLLSEVHISGTEDYLPGADALESDANRQAALRRLAETMMQDAFARLSSGF